MVTYKVKDLQTLKEISGHINAMLRLGVVPGYCMDIIRRHDTGTHKLEMQDTGGYNFQAVIVEKNAEGGNS